ncbi:MAG: ISKra4 family transposase [Blastocatellia bacterium]
MQHSELENLLEIAGRELMRRLLQCHIDERGPGEVSVPVVNADGDALTHRRLQTRPLKSVFGPVTVSRLGYGGPELSSLHPLDAALNLPKDLYSHGVRYKAAKYITDISHNKTVSDLKENIGVPEQSAAPAASSPVKSAASPPVRKDQTPNPPVPKRQLAELVVRAAGDFESFYETRGASAATATGTGAILALSFDNKGVRMHHEDLRPATKLAAEKAKPRLEHRRSQGEKGSRKRMSAVAAVYTIAPFVRTPEEIAGELHPGPRALPATRPRPEDKRVWAEIREPTAEVMRQAFEEALGRDPNQCKRWCVLVDGQPNQLADVEQTVADFGVEVTLILDLIHVLEYLWKAAWALHGAGNRAADAWVSERLLEILRGHGSAVAGGIRRSATLRGLGPAAREPLDKCADYLLKNRGYIRYDEYLAAGFPIATGVIEGACRYLVKDRMDLTGARWRLAGAEAVLRLRSLRTSEDFEEYWEYHLEQEYKRTHAAQYAAGEVPLPAPPAPAKSRRLRLVK